MWCGRELIVIHPSSLVIGLSSCQLSGSEINWYFCKQKTVWIEFVCHFHLDHNNSRLCLLFLCTDYVYATYSIFLIRRFHENVNQFKSACTEYVLASYWSYMYAVSYSVLFSQIWLLGNWVLYHLLKVSWYIAHLVAVLWWFRLHVTTLENDEISILEITLLIETHSHLLLTFH